MKIPLSKITVDPALQARQAMDPAVVAEYAEAMRGGAVFPAVVVFGPSSERTTTYRPDGTVGDLMVDGPAFWLADGFHRVAAALEGGLDAVPVEVRLSGDPRRGALLYSLGANAEHGLRRTNADKRKAVETLLRDPEWALWSDREIAKAANVGHPLVGSIRAELTSTGRNSSSPVSPEKRLGADGKLRKVRSPLTPPPDAWRPERPPMAPTVETPPGKLRGPKLDGEIRHRIEELLALVPDDKMHYVCGQITAMAWEKDPEGEPAQIAARWAEAKAAREKQERRRR